MEPNEIVRAPMVHELKCWPEYYDAVERGDKPFEIRKWDRPYLVRDILLLQEYDPEKQDYTGRQIKRKVTYLLDVTYLPGDNIPHFARYVVLGLEDTRLCDCIEQLQAELEASKRREIAAVEDLKHLADMGGECYGCKHYDGIRCDHAIYRVTCNTETDNHYEWRGPEREGEANHEHDT